MMAKRTDGEAQPLIFLDNSTFAEVISLPPGQCGKRLEALGLRPGKIIKKLYGMPFCGPVTLEIDGRQIAIGYGAASRIIVKALKQEDTILE